MKLEIVAEHLAPVAILGAGTEAKMTMILLHESSID